MSSADREDALARGLIERLLVDPAFRSEFKRDPAAASVAAGLPELATELRGAGRGMQPLAVRESRSSLAGVVMAVAVEGMGIAEARALLAHGLPGAHNGPPGGHRGLPGAARPMSGESHGLGAASHRSPQPSPGLSGVAHGHSLPAGPRDPVATSTAAAGAPAPPAPGAQPVDGGAVPVWPDHTAGAAGAGLAQVLDSARLQASAGARAFLASGSADPRLVSVLDSALANHSIGLGPIESVTDPVHAQGLEITSVDGQPVGPDNVAARDLVTEIAALDPGIRPSEIGTPWPIRSPGFFSDQTVAGRLHLGFEMNGTGSTGADAAVPASPAGVPAENVSAPASSDPSFASPKAHAAFEAAKKELGVRYQWGGTSPQTGFDCSGLVQWAYHQVGIDLPRVAADQFHAGTPVDLAHLREGDLVFFQDSTGYIHHVGMYVGDHKFIEAPHTGDVVKYDDLRSPYWAQQFAGGRRIVPLGASAPTTAQAAGNAGAAGPAAALGSPGAGTPAPAGASTPADGLTPGAVAGAPTGAPQPGTAQFAALVKQERSFHHHTVQFLPAVTPQPGSPLAGMAPAGSGGLGGTSPPAGDLVGQTGAGGSGAQPVSPSSVAADALGATPPDGGALSVSSRLLTSGQEKFAGRFAQLTGLDPRVVAAWQLAEESGGAAQAREQASNFNWLNIGYFDSGAGRIAFDRAFSDPISAAEQSAKFLKGDWGGASSSIRAILTAVGHSPADQMAAIANSDWASSHYGGGANLRGTYDELGDIHIEKTGLA